LSTVAVPWIARQLRALLGQRGHALLLAGPSGLGQYELALALARGWLCERPGADGACGNCASCHAIDVRTHADLMVLLPDALALELDWPLDEKTRDKIEKKEVKPSKWIRVDAARAVVEFAQTTRSRGATKVVLVFPADRLNTESANTLLKTLEEPVGDLRFVLATEAAHLLPATIRSRCQTHAMQWPDEDEAAAWLQLQSPASGGAAAAAGLAPVWLRAAGGRPDDALEWARLGLTAAQWAALPRAVAQADGTALAPWPPAQQLDVLQKVCHDLMSTAAGAPPRYFAAADLPAVSDLFKLQAWARDLAQAARTVEHPFGAGLALEAWLSRARQACATGQNAARQTAGGHTLRA
jgi:DNA polymerase-3 subunit delta'